MNSEELNKKRGFLSITGEEGGMMNLTPSTPFKYKNTPVYVRRWHYGNMPSELQRTCFCCEEKINNCMTVLLINNYKEIPNVILHDECFEQWKDMTDELCSEIAKAHDDYKRLNKIFGS